MKKISVVLPSYNEEKNVAEMYAGLSALLANYKTQYDYEIIFVNDGSADDTWGELQKLSSRDSKVISINLSRNFGHQAALEAGLDAASGDAVIMMDCDGQHPVALIDDMLKKWEEGADIVNTIRVDTEGASFLKKMTSAMFYSVINRFSDVKVVPGSADFRLISRKVLEVLKSLPEQSKFYRGLIGWVGFKSEFLEYKANERKYGKTSYTFRRMYRFAVDGLTGFSNFPLKVAKYIGLFISATGILCLLIMLFLTLFSDSHFPIWVYLIVLLYMLSGLQFIVLWFIGNYVGRIYNQQKSRPNYIISDQLNL